MQKSTPAYLPPILIGLHLLILSNLQFIPWPELHLWPYLIDHGFKLYRDIAFEKPPGLIIVLVFWTKLFGNTLPSLKLLTWIIIAISDYLVFRLSVLIRNQNSKFPLAVLLIFILISSTFLANTLWFDLLLVPITVSTALFIYQKRLFGAGIFFGLSLLVKQNSAIFLIPIIYQIYTSKLPDKQNAYVNFLSGVLSVIIPTCLLFLYFKIIPDGYKWIITFSPTLAKYSFKLPTILQAWSLILLTLPLILLWKKNTPIFLWGISSLLFVFPRFELFHLQPAIPFISLALGWMLKARNKAGIVFFVILAIVSAKQIISLWHKEDRFYEPSTVAISGWIKSHTTKGEKIYLLNTWDHLYVLSGTIPATQTWYPYLPWYINFDSVQDKIVGDLTREKPRIIVSESLPQIPRNKIESFVSNNYTKALLIDNRFTFWQPK